MENQGLINNIKSKYILRNIFNYLQVTNFEMKLFFYSKHIQKIFNIKLFDYKQKYYKKFNLDNFLNTSNYKIGYLTNEFYKFLFENKLKKEEFEKDIYDILNEEEINEDNIFIENSQKLIIIDSPLFDIILKTKNFERNMQYIYLKKI